MPESEIDLLIEKTFCLQVLNVPLFCTTYTSQSYIFVPVISKYFITRFAEPTNINHVVAARESLPATASLGELEERAV